MIEYVHPVSKKKLHFDSLNNSWLENGTLAFRTVNGILRFVDSQLYAGAFGLQWRRFRRTQLDSYTKTTISEDRLKRICGNDLSIFAGKNVLEIGCGAGRFSEILLESGAKLHATDLSSAVEAHFLNFKDRPNYTVCQADLRALPFDYGSFDVVLCLGVIQHTPDPEQTIAEISKYVKKSGILLIDHYTNGVDMADQKPYNVFLTKALLRAFLIRMPPSFTIRFCYGLTWLLWPIHRFFFAFQHRPFVKNLRKYFLMVSPVHDYQDSLPQLGRRNLFEWAVLDTHDACTDRYKHMRSEDDIRKILMKLNFSKIRVWYGGNGVESFSIK